MNFRTSLPNAFFLAAALIWLANFNIATIAETPASTSEILEWGSKSDEPVNSTGRKYYLDRRIAPTMSYAGGADWLVRGNRESEESTREMINHLGLKPGMVVCDFGSGVGYHTLPIAQQIKPDGTVYAVDIQLPMLRGLAARANEAGIENVQLVLSKSNVPQMPAKLFDLILMVDVYHELSLPGETLQQLRQSLNDDGRIALLEFRGEDPDVPIYPEHKMTKAQILKEYASNGFELDSQYDQLPWQHLMFFKVKL